MIRCPTSDRERTSHARAPATQHEFRPARRAVTHCPRILSVVPTLATQFGGLLPVKLIYSSRVFLGGPRNASVQKGLLARLGSGPEPVPFGRTSFAHRTTSERDVVPWLPGWWLTSALGVLQHLRGRVHFHPKMVSSTDTFIQTLFHPMTLSSKNGFIQF